MASAEILGDDNLHKDIEVIELGDVDSDTNSEIDSDDDVAENANKIEDYGAGTKWLVYVLISLKEADIYGMSDGEVWEILKTEQVTKTTIFTHRRVYVGMHSVQPGEPLQARNGHRDKKSAMQAKEDGNEWRIFDWVVVECTDKKDMMRMEAYLYYYCNGWQSEVNDANDGSKVEVMNLVAILTPDSDDADAAADSTDTDNFRPLAVYSPIAEQPEKYKDVGYYVAKSTFRTYTR